MHVVHMSPQGMRVLTAYHFLLTQVLHICRIVDLHSHMGVDSSPLLEGAQDINSLHGPIISWARSIDGLNTHDAAFELAVAGGVTTSLILPGSANAIGMYSPSLSRPPAE